jgi:hydrogenase maturation protein HypF
MTWRIRLQGQVQGVGFRPFVWKLATERGLTGRVANGLAGVEIEVDGSEAAAQAFLDALRSRAPFGSRITDAALGLAEGAQPHQAFSIAESEQKGVPQLLLTPDLALCPECRADMRTAGNRRFGYAFATCTACGPRYSLLEQLPYDRAHTGMRHFAPCADCQREYHAPHDRRFFAQTNSCPSCGVRLRFVDLLENQTIDEQELALKAVLNAWAAGQTVALKGIGGYLLTCDATQADAVMRLRERKNRPSKPFALMYPDEAALRRDADLTEAEKSALHSPVAPIVLVPLRENGTSGLARAAVAPGLEKIGAMLPYAPLFERLLSAFGRPIVATSGNPSGASIAFEDRQTTAWQGLADALLAHDRPIAIPQDDSLLQFAGAQPIVLRRARGLAPTLVLPHIRWPETPVWAVGADLKNTFALTYQRQLFLSQYWGDLADADTQARVETMGQHIRQLLQVAPQCVLGDGHPAYASAAQGRKLATSMGLPFETVPHHAAHCAALLGERNLLQHAGPVLGFVWDGAGWGDDGQIWGGEVFLYAQQTLRRVAHWPYFPWLLGDKMAREPRLSALALFGEAASAPLAKQFSETEWSLYQRMRAQAQGPRTSSVGRAFDALAALLGLAARQTFEGEAALRLEAAARGHLRHNPPPQPRRAAPGTPDWQADILEEIAQKRSVGHVAARFHADLVAWVARTAEQWGIGTLAFSGGVFQNALLVDMLQAALAPRFALYFHQELSPNDENISFGQLVAHHFLHIEKNGERL